MSSIFPPSFFCVPVLLAGSVDAPGATATYLEGHHRGIDSESPGYEAFEVASQEEGSISTEPHPGSPNNQQANASRDPVILFQLPPGESVQLRDILVGLNGNITTNYTFTVRIYSQADVTVSTWSAGTELRSETVTVAPSDFPQSGTLKITLDTPLELPATTGSSGYAIQFVMPANHTFSWSYAGGTGEFPVFRYFRKDDGYAARNGVLMLALVKEAEPSPGAVILLSQMSLTRPELQYDAGEELLP